MSPIVWNVGKGNDPSMTSGFLWAPNIAARVGCEFFIHGDPLEYVLFLKFWSVWLCLNGTDFGSPVDPEECTYSIGSSRSNLCWEGG